MKVKVSDTLGSLKRHLKPIFHGNYSNKQPYCKPLTFSVVTMHELDSSEVCRSRLQPFIVSVCRHPGRSGEDPHLKQDGRKKPSPNSESSTNATELQPMTS